MCLLYTQNTRLLEDQLDRADTLEVCKIADRGTAVHWRAELSTVLYAVRDFRVHFVVASSSAGPSTVRFSRPALKTGANMVSRTKRSARSARSWCLRYSARPGHAVNKLLFSRSQKCLPRGRVGRRPPWRPKSPLPFAPSDGRVHPYPSSCA